MRALMVVVAVALTGCSLVYSDDRYRGSDAGSREPDSQPSCAASNCQRGERCVSGACVPCDGDLDGFDSDDPACEGALRDCDDTDPTIHPGAVAVCGDGRINACPGTGLVVRDEVRDAFGGAEIGALRNVALGALPYAGSGVGGRFDGAQIATIRGSDGVARVVAAYAWTSSDGTISDGYVLLLDGSSFTEAERIELYSIAPGFVTAAVRTLDSGAVRVAAFRYGATDGELYRGLIPAGATSLSELTLERQSVEGTCLVSEGFFGLPRYPYTILRIDGSGAVGGYNRSNDATPFFRVAPGGGVECRGGGFITLDTLVAGGPGTFAFTDDHPSNTTVTVWNGSASANTLQAGLGLSPDGDRSMDFLGVESGSDTERSLLVAPTDPNGVAVVPIDCRVPAFGAECGRYVDATRYVPAGGVTMSEPKLRRLTSRTGVLMWIEDRSVGATPPNTRVQELVAHVTDRDGRIPCANGSDAGAGLSVLRYELDDSRTDYRVVKSVDAAVLRDPATGDVTIYGIGVYSQSVASVSDSPTHSEVRVSGVRICATP